MGLTIDLEPLCAIAIAEGQTPDATLLWQSATDTTFPGAILPVTPAGGGLIVYVAADSPAEWRKLQPLLKAFVGATLTDFDGAPRSLDLARPFDAALSVSGAAVVSWFRPGPFPDADRVVLRALLRLQDRVGAAPTLTSPRPKATSRLLAEFQDALNVGDLNAAGNTLDVLRHELRLDAANLARLEMLILAAGGQWSTVRWHPRFETLVYGAPPPDTANLLLDAIYRVQVAVGDAEELEQKRSAIAPLVASLLSRFACPQTESAQRLHDWLHRSDGIHPNEDGGDHPATGPGDGAAPELIADVLLTHVETPVAQPATSLPESRTERARSALLAAMASSGRDDLPIAILAYDAVSDLTDMERSDLLGRKVFQAIWDELQEQLGHRRPPENWTEWLDRLADPDFDAARIASNNAWALDDLEVDPVDAQRMAEAVLDTSEGLAMDRLAEAMPFLVKWATADVRWPRTALRPFYIALMTAMAISGRGGEVMLKSASPLLDGAIRSGLSVSEYREVLDAAGEIARGGLNRNSIYETLDLLEIARAGPAVDPIALQTFTFSVLNDLAAHASRLTSGQRLALSGLAAETGWSHPLLTSTPLRRDGVVDDILSRVEVAIYTLTEGAARGARDLLLKDHPGIRITLNHDHGGTSGLAALAQRADLFVIVWGSATHAATDFIRDRRDGPLVYASGKGASSIIRAVEDYAASNAIEAAA